MDDAETISGLVVKAQSGFFWVETSQGQIVTTIPGRLKQERLNTDIVAVGDNVHISLIKPGEGLVESVDPRARVLSRARPVGNSRQVLQDREQVLVANPDQVVFILAIKTPRPSLRKLDRLLVVAEYNELPAIICVNKIDLAKPGQAEAMFACYVDLGYEVLFTSAKEGKGIDQLRDTLQNKLTVFAGSSGVGKSSLLNAVQPMLGLQVGLVSKATGKGMHTTRYAELVPLDGGGYVADTPGIRSLALFGIEPGEIDAFFREIAPLVADCRFSDCTHRKEKGCAVLKAVKDGTVYKARYESYIRLRDEHERLENSAYN